MVFATAISILASGGSHASNIQEANLIKFPQSIDPNCNRGRAKLYDECGSQLDIFNNALQVANQQNKTLLVSYGAEWCIWCHVFDQYVIGAHTRMAYRYASPGETSYNGVTLLEKPKYNPSQEAYALKKFVADNFVIAHIESYFAPDGQNVLVKSQANAHFSGGLPFIYTVNQNGEFAASLNSQLVETRRDSEDWYRGYDRINLITELTKMLKQAR